MKTMWIILCAGSLTACDLFAGGISATRDIIYPAQFDIQVAGNRGIPIVIPKSFTTRKVGTSLRIKAVGVVQQTAKRTRQGLAVVKLQLKDGRSLSTTVGRNIKFKGDVYRALGWQGKHYVLRSPKTRKTLYFKKS